ncbi:hypothetical protein HK104_004165 [Borealophlyctis nickersoniae]|nr:hypothetical protein HK104_004165 [Borealophlyctis nickersoniae]
MLGAIFSGIGSFLWIFMTNDLGAQAMLLGLTGPAQVVLQLPFFFYSKLILEKIGVRYAIITAHILMAIRLLAYTFLKPGPMAYAILAVELLHGATFSGLWAAAVAYSTEIAPRGMEFMAQGILGAFYGGLGSGIGGISSGLVYSKYGPIWLFRGMAVLTLISMFIYAAVPTRKLVRTNRVPVDEKILDKQASQGLLEMTMEEGGAGYNVGENGETTGEAPVSTARRASVVAGRALASMARRQSMAGA